MTSKNNAEMKVSAPQAKQQPASQQQMPQGQGQGTLASNASVQGSQG